MTLTPTPARLEVALPAIMTFLFGLGAGVVIGYVAWEGNQEEPAATATSSPSSPPPQAADGSESRRAAPRSPDDDPEVLRKRLEIHQQLLAANPEDVRLLRTVGNYHGMLGQQDEALEAYSKAEALARQKGETTQLVEILTDQAVAMTEKEDFLAAFAKLAEARKAAPTDTRSRLTEAVILMSRVMPSQAPIIDRKEAVARAEALLREVLVIQPGEPNAVEMLSMIEAIRAQMGRGAPAGTPGAAPAP
jgi:tetratricopeptide (TPR) repeat protein